MAVPKQRMKPLLDKIRALPPEKMEAVEDFVDFLSARTPDRRLIRDSARLSERSFRRVWNNPDDAAYDKL